MDKIQEIENQLNNMFQFLFKEDKKYVFIEDDKKGFIDINVTDEKVYNLILEDKQRFAILVNDYVDINIVRIRKYNGLIPNLSRKPKLFSEATKTEYIKQKVFIVKRKKININSEVMGQIEEMKQEMFLIHDKAREECNKYAKDERKEKEEYLFYGIVGTLGSIYQYIKRIEELMK